MSMTTNGEGFAAKDDGVHLVSPAHGGIIECNAVLCHDPATGRLSCDAPMCDKHYHMYVSFTDVLHCSTCDGRNPHCIHGDDTYHDNTLVTVECVYGHTYRVLQRQLNDPRCTQLALFTQDGRRYSDLPPGNIARHGGITLHRENIARVVETNERRYTPMTICFTPNGNVTYEECPVCGHPDVKVEHGCRTRLIPGEEPQNLGLAEDWHCPDCGGQTVIVGFDCPYCGAKPKSKTDEGRSPQPTTPHQRKE